MEGLTLTVEWRGVDREPAITFTFDLTEEHRVGHAGAMFGYALGCLLAAIRDSAANFDAISPGQGRIFRESVQRAGAAEYRGNGSTQIALDMPEPGDEP